MHFVPYRRRAGCLAVVVGLWGLAVAVGQTQDAARQITDTGFRDKRPAAPADQPRKDAPVYKATQTPARAQTPTHIIGFTVWRLRQASRDVVGPRLLVQEDGRPAPVEYGQERLSPGAPLNVGDRIRLGLEVARDGFLYVVDRERYSDGTYGAPQLIFPAGNIRGADNRVRPGMLVEIPGQGDRIPSLRVQRTDQRYVGEELLVIVTAQPLPDLTIADRETPLSPERVAAWEKQWGSETTRLDAADASTSWTTAEQAAGLRQRLLTQDDPMPASIFSVAAKAEGALIRIPLTVR